MLERGDFVVPRVLGRAFLDKPILFFWTELASISALGMNTAAARLPGLLFALLGIATTGWVARVLFSGQQAAGSGQQPTADCQPPAAGWIAATCYATMVLPFLLAQAPVHDMALVPFTNLALGFLWKARRDLGFGIWDLGFAGIALGLSILTKGLEGVAIAGIGYGLYVLLTRAIAWKVVWQAMAVLGIALVFALPWYLAMEAREPGYLRYYFIDRHLLGFATDTQRHGGQPWWFYLPLAIGGGLPWILYLNLSGGRGKGEGGRGQGKGGRGKGAGGRAEMLLWTWLGGALVLLSLSGSKAVTYVLPAMPAIAILAARSWAVALSAESQPPVADPLRVRRLLHAALFFVIAALTPWAARRFGDQPVRAGEAVAFGVLSLAWLWLMVALWRRPAGYGWPRLVVATAATYALAFALLGPPLAQAHSARDLAGYFNASGRLPGTIYIMDGRVSFVYYLRPEVRRTLRADQIQSVSVEQLAAMQPFPRDAVVALPADLGGRLSRVPQLANASRQAAGRYLVVRPGD